MSGLVVVDTSVFVAILFQEDDADALGAAIRRYAPRVPSAANYLARTEQGRRYQKRKTVALLLVLTRNPRLKIRLNGGRNRLRSRPNRATHPVLSGTLESQSHTAVRFLMGDELCRPDPVDHPSGLR